MDSSVAARPIFLLRGVSPAWLHCAGGRSKRAEWGSWGCPQTGRGSGNAARRPVHRASQLPLTPRPATTTTAVRPMVEGAGPSGPLTCGGGLMPILPPPSNPQEDQNEEVPKRQ